MANKKCGNCRTRLENLIVKSLQMNVPDGVRGRDICPNCNKGCIAYDIYIYHNEAEQLTYRKTEEQKYGLCCSCGKRGDRRLWVKPSQEAEPPLSSHEEMLADYMDATPEEIEFAKGILGKDPFEEDLQVRMRKAFEDKPEEPPMSIKEIDAEVKACRKEQREKKKGK